MSVASLPEFKFTKTAIDTLSLPTAGRVEYKDTKTPALRLRVTAAGAKTLSYYGRVKGGRVQRITIGKVDAVTVDRARDLARSYGEAMAVGQVPDTARRDASAPTIGDTLDLFLEHKRNKRGQPLAAKTKLDYRGNADRYLGKYLKYQLAEFTHDHLAKLHSQLGKDHAVTANRVLALVSTLYSYAIKDRGYAGDNPAQRIRKFAEDDRERVFSPAELRRLWDALDKEPTDFADVFRLALLTGARRSNVLSMRWADVDLQRREWRMRQKGDRLHVVPLVPAAVTLLKGRPQGGEWVFPADSDSGHLAEPKTAWARVCKAAQLKDARIHDMRRTVGTELAATGANMAMSMAALGHQTTRAALVYQRIAERQSSVRDAMKTATSKMAGYQRKGRAK